LPQTKPGTFTVFVGERRIAYGSLEEVARAAKAAEDAGEAALLAFNDDTGQPLELDLRGSIEDVLARLHSPPRNPQPASRGRPRLGVTAREVTLLPSHWEWLASQPGGASAALRRLVDQARRAGTDRLREAQEAAHRVMFAIAGDAPDFEEATRAVYAKDYARFDLLSASWPRDVGDYVRSFVHRVAAQEAAAVE
jgi:uncharacterized protein